MLNLSVIQLSVEAHSYPLSLRDQLSTGDPVEITAMAAAFAKAANDQTLAAELATQQLQLTIGGYESDQATPIDYSAEVQTTSQTLGGNAAALRQIATTLDSIADALATHTHTAVAMVEQLEMDLDNLGKSYWAKAETGVWPPEDLQQLAVSLHNSGVGLVASCGASVQAAVEDYEAVLASAHMALADLGYIAPDALDEGPGDVGVPTPQTAAQQVIQITSTPPTPGQALALVGATAYLALLDGKARSGVPLTLTEQAWLTTYYDQTVPYFPQIKTWADQAPPESTGPVTQIADGLLALSLAVPYVKLPQALQDVLAGNLGITNGGLSGPDVLQAPTFPPTGDPRLTRYAATIGLIADYSSAGAAPGDELAAHLTDAAIRWKQQLNTMYTNYVADVQVWNMQHPGDQLTVMSDSDWSAMFPDGVSSDALVLVSRNNDYSNSLITEDPEVRRTLMGLNWQDGRGAAAVLVSAVTEGPDVSATQAAHAALVMVKDTASDYAGLQAKANTEVKAAIAVVGIKYIDSFAIDSDGGATLVLPNGSTVVGLDLDGATQQAYLKFVAGSDPVIYQHFREAALQRATWYVAEELSVTGGQYADPRVQAAMATSMQLMGGVDGALPAYLLEAGNDKAAEASDLAAKAAALEQAQAASTADVLNNASNVLGTVADLAVAFPLTGGSAVAGVASTASAVISAMLDPTGQSLTPPAATATASAVKDIGLAAQQKALAESKMYETMAIVSEGAAKSAAVALIGDRPTPTAQNADGSCTKTFIDWVVDNSADSVEARLRTAIASATGSATGQPTDSVGYGAEFDPFISGPNADSSTVGDSTGGWGDADNSYDIYYGKQEAFVVPPGHGITSAAPDDNPNTKTPAPAVPSAS